MTNANRSSRGFYVLLLTCLFIVLTGHNGPLRAKAPEWLDELNRIHAKCQQMLARVGGHLDGIFFCQHAPDAGCNCRKPAPGLLQAIGRRFSSDLAGVPVVGDSLRDLQAAVKELQSQGYDIPDYPEEPETDEEPGEEEESPRSGERAAAEAPDSVEIEFDGIRRRGVGFCGHRHLPKLSHRGV